MCSIDDFCSLNAPSKMVITQHSRIRFAERGIEINDVCNAISSGIIIEQYPEDYPFPSCLILGNSNDKILHVVASINDSIIYIVTAYIPSPEKWELDWKSRKGESK